MTNQRKPIRAGEYARLHNRAKAAAERLGDLARRLGWQSVAGHSSRLAEILRSTGYRVVITGRSRAGKSTLVNALVGKQICPSNRVTTTAVPIIVSPGEVEQATISFAKGDPVTIPSPVSADVLRPFADQAHNRDNVRNVSHIVVTLANEVLELGVTYVDIAGVDDASPRISELVDHALHDANALVLVVDVSPFANGGFAFDRLTLELLKDAEERGRPAFVVCNKFDALSEGDQKAVVTEVRESLERAGRLKHLVTAPFFLSASSANSAREKPTLQNSGYVEFERALWEFLWNSDDTGLRRLHWVFAELAAACDEATALIETRTAKGPERSRLRKALTVCADDSDAALNEWSGAVQRAQRSVEDGIALAQSDVTTSVAQYISRQSPSDLPRISQAAEELRGRLVNQCDTLAREAIDPMIAAAGHCEQRVAAAINALRDKIGGSGGRSTQRLQVSLNTLGFPTAPSSGRVGQVLRRVVAAGGVTAVAAAAFAMPVAIAPLIGAAAVALWDLFTDTPESVAALSSQLMKRFSSQLADHHQTLLAHIARCDDAVQRLLREHGRLFAADVSNRLEDIRPLTSEETALFAAMHKEVEHAVAVLDQLFKQPLVEVNAP